MSQGPQNLTINYSLPAVKQLSDGSLPGVTMGQSPADNISFYGDTPVPAILQGSMQGANGVLTVYTTSQSAAAVTANTTSEVSMTVTGVVSTDMVVAMIKPTSQAGLVVGAGRVSATNTVRATLGNLTGSTITPTTTESWLVVTASSTIKFPAVALSPVSVAAATTVEQQFTVTGVRPGMVIAVNKPTTQAGLMITNARVVANDTIGITFLNATTATVITPTAAESYQVFAAQGLMVQPVMTNITAMLAPASVAANTSAEQTFTVPGLLVGTAVTVDKPSLTTGLTMGGERVSAANQLAITFGNVTAAAITPPAEVYTIGLYPDVAPAAGSANAQLASVGSAAGFVLNYVGLTQ